MRYKNYTFDEDELYQLYLLYSCSEKPYEEMTKTDAANELYLDKLFSDKDTDRLVSIIEKMTDDEWVEFRNWIPKLKDFITVYENDPLIDENGCFIGYPEDEE